MLWRMIEPDVGCRAVVFHLSGSLSQIGSFAFIECGPVIPRHWRNCAIDHRDVVAHDGQKRHTPALDMPPDPPPSAQPRGRDRSVVMCAGIHEAAVAEDKGVLHGPCSGARRA